MMVANMYKVSVDVAVEFSTTGMFTKVSGSVSSL